MKTNISFLNSELNSLLHNEDASEEVICSVNREISMLHRKLSLINNTNLVQKVRDNDFQRKTLEFKPYFFEPLISMEKMATIRKSDKGLKKGDIVECAVKGSSFCLHRIVRRVEEVRFKDLNGRHAWFEGYKHVDLLKHELRDIYPDIRDDTVLFQIKFERPSKELNKLRFREECQ